MEKLSWASREIEEAGFDLPPGFRFHPTDEELISHYLFPKVFDGSFISKAIGDADLNKVEPWELPRKAKMGEKEWYFYSLKDKKYPTGLRTNRATGAGYWKATGKDKEIYKAKTLIGMKKTLVFYKGRAPKGEKSNWVIHEYRLAGEFNFNHNPPKLSMGEWVICRVFHKSSGGKKMHISGLTRMNDMGVEYDPADLPPLMDLSSFGGRGREIPTARTATIGETSHVTCFSKLMEDKKRREDVAGGRFDNSFRMTTDERFDVSPVPNSFISNRFLPNSGNSWYQNPVWMQDQPALKDLVESDAQPNAVRCPKQELSQETDLSSGLSNQEMGQGCYGDEDYPFNLCGSVDLYSLWNY